MTADLRQALIDALMAMPECYEWPTRRDDGGGYYSPSVDDVVDVVLAVLSGEDENAQLREALREQWWSNHAEHCSMEWPHADGRNCYWPQPPLLAEEPRSYGGVPA